MNYQHNLRAGTVCVVLVFQQTVNSSVAYGTEHLFDNTRYLLLNSRNYVSFQLQVFKYFTKITRTALESLRYRVADVWQGLTRNVVKEARMRDVRNTLLMSSKLKEYFEQHPQVVNSSVLYTLLM